MQTANHAAPSSHFIDMAMLSLRWRRISHDHAALLEFGITGMTLVQLDPRWILPTITFNRPSIFSIWFMVTMFFYLICRNSVRWRLKSILEIFYSFVALVGEGSVVTAVCSTS
jgi:hypothetical protein